MTDALLIEELRIDHDWLLSLRITGHAGESTSERIARERRNGRIDRLASIVNCHLAALQGRGAGQQHKALQWAEPILRRIANGYGQQDEEDNWHECMVCHGWVDHHGHATTCELMALLAEIQAVLKSLSPTPKGADGP